MLEAANKEPMRQKRTRRKRDISYYGEIDEIEWKKWASSDCAAVKMKNGTQCFSLVRRKAKTHERRRKKSPIYCRKATFKVTISILGFASDAVTFYTQFCIRDITNLRSLNRLFVFMFVHRAFGPSACVGPFLFFVRKAHTYTYSIIIIIVARTAKGLPPLRAQIQ